MVLHTEVEHLSRDGKGEGDKVKHLNHLEEGVGALGDEHGTNVVDEAYGPCQKEAGHGSKQNAP